MILSTGRLAMGADRGQQPSLQRGSSYEIETVPGDHLDLPDVARLLDTVFVRRQFDATYLRWQYLANPCGRALASSAYHEGRLVAHLAVLPLRARVENLEERGVLTVNAATHPAHRRRGLISTLLERVLACAADAGFHFAIGVPNSSSTRAFVENLGFQLVCPLQVRAGLGRLPARLRRVEYQFERLWSAGQLGWRLARPHVSYSVREGQIMTSALCRRVGVYLGSAPGLTEDRPAPHPCRVWIGLDGALRWRWKPYVSIPTRLRPSPLNLVFKDLTNRGRRLEPDRIRFQGLDFDAF